MSDADAPPASGFRGLGRTEITRAGELEPVDAHRDRVLADLAPLDPIELNLWEALNHVLAEDVAATEPLPAFPNSAMDGYAVVAADLADADPQRPVRLPVTGEVAAGVGAPATVAPGTAVRIMTGAPLPEGADAVVPVEQTREADGVVEVFVAPSPGAHVRRAGEDVRPGERLLGRGRRLRAAEIGLLAAVGHVRLRCHPLPRVVVFSTGSELVPPGEPLAPGTVRDVNGPMLAALARQAGAVPFQAGIVPDDRHSLIDAIDSNLGHADLFVTTGGVSAGTRDHVRDVLALLGDVTVTKVAMKPGMPQVYGRVRGAPFFGLPGNPVSAFVSFEVFVRPAIRRLQGRRDLHRPVVLARMDADVRTSPDKRTFLRVRLRQEASGWVAALAGGQGSHQLAPLARADGLAEVPEGTGGVDAGGDVRVHLLVEQ